MKRALLVVCCLFMMVLPAAQVFALDEGVYSYWGMEVEPKPKIAVVTVSNGDKATVHEYFKQGKPVLDTLPDGEAVVVLQGFSPDGKYNHIMYAKGTKSGWILGKYLKFLPQ